MFAARKDAVHIALFYCFFQLPQMGEFCCPHFTLVAEWSNFKSSTVLVCYNAAKPIYMRFRNLVNSHIVFRRRSLIERLNTPFEVDRDSAKRHISETCGTGWLDLVELVYDNKPPGVEITEVCQKWAGLKVSYTGENGQFKDLTEMVYYISQKICEVCGATGCYTIIDGWETTLCDRHFDASPAKEKYREERKR